MRLHNYKLDIELINVHTLDPLTDPRWPTFLESHPDASIFHTPEWLSALRKTYGYKPMVFTASEGEHLENAVLFCEIASWMTGKRLVSLPFSDHCQPLACGRDLAIIIDHLHRQQAKDQLKYIELRPMPGFSASDMASHYLESEAFSFQKIDLRPDLAVIYKRFHDSCIRRKIRRAEREDLVYEVGRSEDLLRKFRHLLLLTRRRHGVPPQPDSWFQNIIKALGESVKIHLLSKGTVPVASIITLSYKKSLIYKYGCSDTQFNSMGGTPLLFWKVIQQAKDDGIEEFDLGRSGYDDQGLIAFKQHLGAATFQLKYYRDTTSLPKAESAISTASFLTRQALTRLPNPLFAGVGKLFYRHLG